MNMGEMEVNEDEFWPLSGKPFFSVLFSKSNVKPAYHLLIPAKIQRDLPPSPCPVVLTYGGKKWDMLYSGNDHRKRFNAKWKEFVIDNNLKIDDACVFEIVNCSNTKIEFRVQILRGDMPPELIRKEDGYNEDTPIKIDD